MTVLSLDEHAALAPRSISGERLCRLIAERTGNTDLAHDARVVSAVLPFKASSYVVDELIDWDKAPDDPIYRLTFPHRDMLEIEHFELVEEAVLAGDKEGIRQAVTKVQYALNPHPSNQLSHERSAGRGPRRLGLAAQVSGDASCVSASGADLPQLLRILLPLGAVRGAARAEAGGARARDDDPLPRPASGGHRRAPDRRRSPGHADRSAGQLPGAAARAGPGARRDDPDRNQGPLVLAVPAAGRTRGRQPAPACSSG